ncbi:hypothetical protein BC828DRAFT_417110 [Blastocladiella britannica]|nr:hypothetical protein BC828DRAFT_417110 [Blastocladiella britannica]
MSIYPTSPDDFALAPASSLIARGVSGPLSVKLMSERLLRFEGQRVRNIQANFSLPAVPAVPAEHTPSPAQRLWAECDDDTSSSTSGSEMVPDHISYFECTVRGQLRGPASLVCVGVAGSDLPGFVLGPGMHGSGVGYESTGIKWVNGHNVTSYGTHYGVGDTVGIGCDHVRSIVFFTLNGVFQGTAAAECVPLNSGELYPTIGGTRGAAVSINFGSDAFMWDEANDLGYGFCCEALPSYISDNNRPSSWLLPSYASE